MILLGDSEGSDQTTRNRWLIWAFAVRTLGSKIHFRMTWPNVSYSFVLYNSSLTDKTLAFIDYLLDHKLPCNF